MKIKITSLLVVMLMIAGIGCKQSSAGNDFITVDITTNYPKKELILQDFMDVEYLVLETNDEFITQGSVMAIGNKYLLVKNWTNDGDMFIFDSKTGKGLRKINRRGQGAEEYTYINGIILDEDHDEMFVNCAQTKKILVYDLLGNFKRSFNHADESQYLDIFNYDKNNLICYDTSGYIMDGADRDKQYYHAIISKQDGRVTRSIPIPFDIIKAPMVQKGDGIAVASVRPIIPYYENWLLVETSSDTVYCYIPKKNKLIPFLISSSSDPEILLTMGTLTDRFYFIQIIKKIYNFTTGRGFPTTDLMYDKLENTLFNATILNGDFVKKHSVNMTSQPVNKEIVTFQNLTAYQLVEAYEKNELKGKLKEISADLDYESNPVIMLVKHKK